MNRRFSLFLCGLIVFSSQHAVLAQNLRGSALPTRKALARIGLQRMWFSQAAMNPLRDKVSHMHVDEENLYVLASSNLITVYNNNTGKKLWSRQLGRRDAPAFAPVSNKNVVLVAAGTQVFCLDKFSGKTVWEIKTPAQPSTSPAMDNERLYIGTLDGSVFCFNLRKIKELYSEGLLPQWSYQTVLWRHKAGKKVTTPPIPVRVRVPKKLGTPAPLDGSPAPSGQQTETARSVVFASRDNSVYAVSSLQHQLLWQLEMDKPASAPLTEHNHSIFMASEDNKLYCLNSGSGAVRWTLETGLKIRQAPYVVGPHVFLAPSRGGVYCVKAVSGRELWWRPKLHEFVGATDKHVYAFDRFGNLVKVNRESGGIKGAIPLRAFKVRIHNMRTDRVFLATESGLVICLAELGAGLPNFHKHPERKPLLPEFADK